MEATIDDIKKAVILQNLNALGNSFFSHVTETDQIPEEILLNIANITGYTSGYVKLEWIIDIEIREKINCVNNLKTILEYRDPINAPAHIIFGSLECVRKHYDSDNVYFVKYDQNDDKQTSIYISI